MTPKRRIIPIFVPHLGCEHDCVFCNQRQITGMQKPATAESIQKTLRDIGTKKDEPSELAFYGGSFTAIPEEMQEELLAAAQPFLKQNPQNSLRVSTRPDCIDNKILKRLSDYGVKTVELGTQSMCNDVLTLSNRGHSDADTIQAAAMIKQGGFNLILQMMTGLPGDTPEKSIETARRLAELKPDGVRIYPTAIIEKTPLYDLWKRGEYKEHTVEDAVSLCAEIVPIFMEAAIPIIRLGLNPTEELTSGSAVAGAYHPAFGELVYSQMFLNKARGLLEKADGSTVELGVNSACVSIMIGHKRCNIAKLKSELRIKEIKVKPCDVKWGEIVILNIEK